jgi:NTE family protein
MTAARLGIALGSGSARGWAHIGILRALADLGLQPSIVTGASVGALVGAAYANGRLDALEEWVRALTQRDVWRLMDATFRGGGVMTGNRLMEAIAARVGDTPIERLPIAFGAVATDLYSGEEIWLREGPMMRVVRASSGVPGLFAPALHAGRWLIDGGVVNPVPVSLCRAMGADVVIAVDLSRSVTRAGQRAQQTTSLKSEAAAADSALPATEEGSAILKKWSGLLDGLVESFRSKRQEPGLLEAMTSSVNIMQDRITRSRLAIDPADMLLRPRMDDFALMDFHRAREAIDAGRVCIESAAPQLLSVVAGSNLAAPKPEPARTDS